MRSDLFQATVRSVALVVLCIALLSAAGCAPEEQTDDSNNVVVGAILPLSGEHASFGTTARAAFELAQEDAASAGGLVIPIAYGDSQLDQDKALSQWRRLVEGEGVVAFTEVTGSGVALALAGIAERDRTPMVSGINTSPALTQEGGNYFFRVIPSDAYSTKVLSEWAVGEDRTQGALIYNQQNDWAVGFQNAIRDAFPSAGGVLTEGGVIAVTDDTVDFGPAISTIRSAAPQAVFVGLMGRQAGLFVSQAADRGLDGPFFGVDNFAQQEFVEAAGSSAEQARMALPSEATSERAREFARRYREKTGREADAIAFKAHEAYSVLVAAIAQVVAEGGPVTGESIRDALADIRIDGITGPIAFDENNDLAEADYSRYAFGPDGEQVEYSAE